MSPSPREREGHAHTRIETLNKRQTFDFVERLVDDGVIVSDTLEVGQRKSTAKMRVTARVFQSIHFLDGGFPQSNRLQFLTEERERSSEKFSCHFGTIRLFLLCSFTSVSERKRYARTDQRTDDIPF